MSGRIIALHGDLHETASALLPWYVTGTLDDEERARVETHLKTCAQCQADLAAERRLHGLVAQADDETGTAEAGWAALRPRLGARPGVTRRLGQQWRTSASWLRWAVAAQFAAIVIGGTFLWQTQQKPAAPAVYRALGSAPESAAGNVVVVFRPDASERDLRQALRDSHARLVDGPTAADAYILHVTPKARDAALAALRKKPVVVLAEAIDAGSAPGSAP